MTLSKYLKQNFTWRQVPKIIFIIAISLVVLNGLMNINDTLLEPFSNKLSMTLVPFVMFIVLYVAYALWYTPRWSYTHGNNKNIYIAIPYEFRLHYKGKVYISL